MSGGQLAALALLGVFHGIDPGMGWLFAVSFGLQERSRRAVLRSLPPIALGHEAAIAIMIVVLTITSSLFEFPTTIARFGSRLAVANAKFDTGFPPTATQFEVNVVPR